MLLVEKKVKLKIYHKTKAWHGIVKVISVLSYRTSKFDYFLFFINYYVQEEKNFFSPELSSE